MTGVQTCALPIWALSIPAFQSLRRSDQQILLDETLIDLILLTGLQYRGSSSSELTALLTQPNHFNLTDSWRIKDVADYIESINLDHIEYTCLKALLLFRPGNVIEALKKPENKKSNQMFL